MHQRGRRLQIAERGRAPAGVALERSPGRETGAPGVFSDDESPFRADHGRIDTGDRHVVLRFTEIDGRPQLSQMGVHFGGLVSRGEGYEDRARRKARATYRGGFRSVADLRGDPVPRLQSRREHAAGESLRLVGEAPCGPYV